MTLGELFLKELEAEAKATRACVERFKAELFDWKPHDKSMAMGYLSLLVAEIPLWLQAMVEVGEIDFANWKHAQVKTGEEMAKHFDENMESARKALKNASDEELEKPFYLKANGQTLMTDTKRNSISSSINHLVHHRGQLTVYMRLNDIPVPSIYGPSADDKTF